MAFIARGFRESLSLNNSDYVYPYFQIFKYYIELKIISVFGFSRPFFL